jgi:hypothetical protein
MFRSPSYNGARHGLETWSQLVSFDDVTETLQMMDKVRVATK